MYISDLLCVNLDKVCIYVSIGNSEFQDLYKGEARDIPFDLRIKKVKCIGAKRKGILDIEIKG